MVTGIIIALTICALILLHDDDINKMQLWHRFLNTVHSLLLCTVCAHSNSSTVGNSHRGGFLTTHKSRDLGVNSEIAEFKSGQCLSEA